MYPQIKSYPSKIEKYYLKIDPPKAQDIHLNSIHTWHFYLSVGNVLFGVVLQGYPWRAEINQAVWKISLHQACCICIILVSKYLWDTSQNMIFIPVTLRLVFANLLTNSSSFMQLRTRRKRSLNLIRFCAWNIEWTVISFC